MKVIDLIDRIRSLVGDEDSNNYRYTDNQYRDTKIPAGLKRYNLNNYNRITITGTGDDATFSPTPTDEEATKICLYTAIAILDGEIVKAGNNAVVVSNPAGRTDLTEVVRALKLQRDELMKELEKYKSETLTNKASEAIEVDDIGF